MKWAGAHHPLLKAGHLDRPFRRSRPVTGPAGTEKLEADPERAA